MGQLLQIWAKLAGAGLGQICQKGPDAGPAVAEAEIWYIPSMAALVHRYTTLLSIDFQKLNITNSAANFHPSFCYNSVNGW